MNIKSLLSSTSRELQQVGIDTARLDAELLLLHVTGLRGEDLWREPERGLLNTQIDRFQKLVNQRIQRIPLAYLTGQKEFYGREFLINSNVLIPRPETEILIEWILLISKEREWLNSGQDRQLKIAEIGTGSGVIIISIAKELESINENQKSKIYYCATDFSQEALQIARKNAQIYGVKIDFINCDLAEELSGGSDLVVANLPYLTNEEMKNLQPEVEYEPQLALAGGRDGLDLYRRLFEQLKSKNFQGLILLEHGFEQGDGIRESALETWFDCQTETREDLAGKTRCSLIKINKEEKA